jgi:cellulose 1,4-beta-cellobiosidase
MLEQMKTIPSAFWIDNYGKIRGSNRLDTLEGILQDAASKSDPPLCVFIFYDLPNRDCNAKASNGEISFGEQDVAEASEAALAIYRTRYVDPFVAVLGEYPRVPVVIVIEPDSLGNVISNAGQHSCTAATVATYKLGVRYAVDALSGARGHLAAGGTVGASMGAPIALYVDAAHGGWMGFEPNAQAFVSLMIEIGILDKIRGFTTNVANYQPLGEGALCPAEAYERAGEMLHGAVLGVADWCKKHVEHACCTEDPCEVLGLGSGGSTELSYVQSLQQHFVMRTGWQPHFVIDTGRNGRPHARSSCRSWCNINGAGAGHVPTMNTGLPSVVDAFYWLKTPGESDGCTRLLPSGQSCARFDSDCEGRDSITTPAAPEAGRWFHYQATMLARNADLRLDEAGALESTFGMTFRPPPPPSFASPLPPLPPPPSSASPPPPNAC